LAHDPTDDPFVPVPLRGRFFQSSAFFPMPIVLIGTRAEDGSMNLAPYSLCFPHIDPARGAEEHALVLVTQGLSKTAENIARTGRATLNFLPDEPEHLASFRALARPLPTAEKMAASPFTFVPPTVTEYGDARPPERVREAAQVFECRLDRGEPTELADGGRRFVLRVEAVHLAPRWHAALEAGRGAPRLPVDYGFREASATWISRPRVMTSGPRLRPRFEIVTAWAPGDVTAAFADALARTDIPVAGAIAGQHLQLGLPEEERTFWTPHLDLQVEPHEEGAILRGRIGPHPHVWMMFMGLHLFVALCLVGGLMWGISQMVAGGSPWALWIVPGCLALHAFIAGAAFIGQGLGADQTYRLRTFLDETLSSMRGP